MGKHKKYGLVVTLADIRTAPESGHVSIVDVLAFLRKSTAHAAASHLAKLSKVEGRCPNLKLACGQGVRFRTRSGQPGYLYQRKLSSAARSCAQLIKCVLEIYNALYRGGQPRSASRSELQHCFRDQYVLLQTGLQHTINVLWPDENCAWPELDEQSYASGGCEQLDGDLVPPPSADYACSLPLPAYIEPVASNTFQHLHSIEDEDVSVDLRQPVHTQVSVQSVQRACSMVAGATFNEKALNIVCDLEDVPTLIDAVGLHPASTFQLREHKKIPAGHHYYTWKCRLSDKPERKKKKKPNGGVNASAAKASIPSDSTDTVRACYELKSGSNGGIVRR